MLEDAAFVVRLGASIRSGMSAVCTVEGHRPLWASIVEGRHSELTHHGDIRDETEDLDAAVMARCEVRFQKQGRQKLHKQAAGSPEAATAAQSPPASPPAEVFSHISAALIHGLPIAYPVTHQVEVVRPGVNRRFKSIHVRGRTIPRHHRQAVRGTEVTTLERTLIDVAHTYNPDISVSMLGDALRRSLTTREKILQTLAQCLEIRNTKKVRLALDPADGRRESPAESIVAVRFFQHGFAGFVPQGRVRRGRTADKDSRRLLPQSGTTDRWEDISMNDAEAGAR